MRNNIIKSNIRGPTAEQTQVCKYYITHTVHVLRYVQVQLSAAINEPLPKLTFSMKKTCFAVDLPHHPSNIFFQKLSSDSWIMEM